MYAEVVVLTYQSPDIPFFTYKIPQDLENQIKVGQLVEVPFGSRNPCGLVIAIRHSPLAISEKARIKEISNTLMSQPILLPYQVELLKWMSKYYIAPMVNCLEAMLPELPRKLLMENSKWKESIHHSPFTIYQTLILVPSINRIPETLAKFPKAKNYVIYHNELRPAEKFATFLKILEGNIDHIFGSRSAIFAPCPNLSEIIIFDEHEKAYKDERSPYYDTLTVAEKIAQLTHAKITIEDIAPKITTYFNLQKHVKIKSQKTKFKIVSLETERLGGNYSPVTQESEEFLKRIVKSKKNALLFLNKKQESGHIFCKNCKNKEFLENQPETCPNCNSPDFFFNVLNIFSLKEKIQKLIPSAKINLIYQHTHHSLVLSEVEGSLITHHSIDIATSYIFYAPIIKKYELVIFTLADSITQIADFSSEEILYRTIAKLKSLLVANGLLLIQTYSPQNQTINYAAASDYKSFYNFVLAQRKLLSYPPYSLLIKLTLKGPIKETVEKNAKQLAESLNPLTINHSPFTVLGPFKPIYFAKYPAYSIIIKYKLVSYSLAHREKAIENLRPVLKNLKNVQITVEPESIN